MRLGLPGLIQEFEFPNSSDIEKVQVSRVRVFIVNQSTSRMGDHHVVCLGIISFPNPPCLAKGCFESLAFCERGTGLSYSGACQGGLHYEPTEFTQKPRQTLITRVTKI